MINQVRSNSPLIHCITNYVTVNDVANIILATGGSPIMADSIREVEEINSICNGLMMNIGTLNERTIDSMILAGKQANRLGHVVVFDPVGAGASTLRTQTAQQILQEITCTVIRGNASEIKTIARGSRTTSGVDVAITDQITEENLEETVDWLKTLSRQLNTIVVMTGAIDLVSDGTKVGIVRNGHSWMSKVTGTGCMLDGVIASFGSANSSHLLEAVVSAVAAEGVCGERAYRKTQQASGGIASFRMHLIDEMSQLTDQSIMEDQKIEFR